MLDASQKVPANNDDSNSRPIIIWGLFKQRRDFICQECTIRTTAIQFPVGIFIMIRIGRGANIQLSASIVLFLPTTKPSMSHVHINIVRSYLPLFNNKIEYENLRICTVEVRSVSHGKSVYRYFFRSSTFDCDLCTNKHDTFNKVSWLTKFHFKIMHHQDWFTKLFFSDFSQRPLKIQSLISRIFVPTSRIFDPLFTKMMIELCSNSAKRWKRAIQWPFYVFEKTAPLCSLSFSTCILTDLFSLLLWSCFLV